MGHPLFPDAPSRDMTKAQERQAELDAQIEAFLAKGGEIKAFDNLCRPVESRPWGSKSLHPVPQAPAKVPAVKTEPAAKAPTADIVAPQPEVLPQEPTPAEPVQTEQSDERLAVKIIIEAALGGSSRVIARNLQIPLPRCRAIAKQYHVQFRA